MHLSTIEEAIKDIELGNIIIIIDDETRENEGDFMLAAEKATAEKVNFLIKGGGLVCVPIVGERLDELDIPLMVREEENTEITRCKFTVSVDLNNKTTGISARDRAETIKALIDPEKKPKDFARPGHIFPLRYEKGGVLKRDGHTEAAVDLCKLARLYPAAVICEILNEKGDAARFDELLSVAEKNNLKIVSIKDLIRYIKAQKE